MPAASAANLQIALILARSIAAAQDSTPTARRKSAEAAAGAGLAGDGRGCRDVPATVAAQATPVERGRRGEVRAGIPLPRTPAPVDESEDDVGEAVESQTPSSTEQGQTPMSESFEPNTRRERITEQRKAALEDTKCHVHLRTFYLDRDKFDDSESEAWAVGRLGRVQDRLLPRPLSLGATGYLSQPLYGARRQGRHRCCCNRARTATP